VGGDSTFANNHWELPPSLPGDGFRLYVMRWAMSAFACGISTHFAGDGSGFTSTGFSPAPAAAIPHLHQCNWLRGGRHPRNASFSQLLLQVTKTRLFWKALRRGPTKMQKRHAIAGSSIYGLPAPHNKRLPRQLMNLSAQLATKLPSLAKQFWRTNPLKLLLLTPLISKSPCITSGRFPRPTPRRVILGSVDASGRERIIDERSSK
jgi:hypothetical protein